MNKINENSYSKELFDEENIKNNLFNLCLLIKSKISNKNEINILKENLNINDLFSILKNLIQLLLNSINNNINNNQYQLQLENHIIKLESDIRYYLKREFQFKIIKDSLEMKIRGYMNMEEDYFILKEKMRYEGGKFLNNDRKDNEIIILRKENCILKEDISKLEDKNKELNNIIIKNQNIIKILKERNSQLNELVNELKVNKNNNNNNIHNIHNNSSINLNIINNNNGNKIHCLIKNSSKKLYNITSTKKYFETLNKNYKTNLQKKHRLNLYHSPKMIYQHESTNNYKNKNKIDNNINKKKNKISNTIDNNKLFIKTYSRITKSNTNNNKYRNKKFKGSPISMRLDDNEKSDILNKCLSVNNNSKCLSSIKTRSFNKNNKSITKCKVPLSNKNESFIKKYENIRHSMSRKKFQKIMHLNEHASFIIKKIIKNK